MKYEKLVKDIVEKIGGEENIDSVYHCATRLRFQLKDTAKVDEDGIKAIDGVLSLVLGGGQHQIVIGQHVGEVYKDLLTYTHRTEGAELKDAAEFKQEMKKKKLSNQFIDVISGVFTPVLGMLMATGVIKGLLALLSATGILAADSGTYQILNIVGDCFFYFFPVFLGYTAMKKFGGTPFIGMAVGAAMIYPGLAGIMAGEPLYTLFAGTIFESPVYLTFLGIPVILMSYASSVIPIVITSFFAAKIEKFWDKRTHASIKSFAVPMMTLLVSIPLAFIAIGPVSTWASNILGEIAITVYNVNATIAGFLYGALIQLCVMFGLHWGFVAISVNNMATLGFDPVTIAGLASAFGQAGVVFMIMLKTRNKKLKGVCGPALLSALFGITEPAIYGVTLQFKKPFILASLASGIGGAIIGFGGVKQYFYGINGIFGFIQVINPQTGFDSSVAAAIIACIVSFAASCLLMALFGFKNSGIEMKEN